MWVKYFMEDKICNGKLLNIDIPPLKPSLTTQHLLQCKTDNALINLPHNENIYCMCNSSPSLFNLVNHKKQYTKANIETGAQFIKAFSTSIWCLYGLAIRHF